MAPVPAGTGRRAQAAAGPAGGQARRGWGHMSSPRAVAAEVLRGRGRGAAAEGGGGEATPTRLSSQEPVTLGLRGSRRRPAQSGAAQQAAASDGAPAHADPPEPEEEDPFARMNPAQARAARIRRDRAAAAKLVAEQKLAERAARQAAEAELAAQPAPARPAAPAAAAPAQRGPAAWWLAHGQHFPHGFQAVEYAYGGDGTWKRVGEVRYECNLFREHASEAHPLDPERLEDACSRKHHTCCDLDGNILFDPGRLGKLQQCCGGAAFAFHEHNGLAGSSRKVGRPRLLFSFDDNVLGHCISQIYSKPAPAGLDASDVNTMNQTFCRCDFVVSARWLELGESSNI